MAVFSIINTLLLILLIGVGVSALVLLFMVLIKANKALDIWLMRNKKK